MYQTFGPKKKKSALSENANTIYIYIFLDGTNTIYFDNLFMWQVGGIATKINHDKSCSPTPIISRELSDSKRDKHVTFIQLYIDKSRTQHNTIIDTLLLLEKN